MTDCNSCGRLRERIEALQDHISFLKLQVEHANTACDYWRNEALINMRLIYCGASANAQALKVTKEGIK